MNKYIITLKTCNIPDNLNTQQKRQFMKEEARGKVQEFKSYISDLKINIVDSIEENILPFLIISCESNLIEQIEQIPVVSRVTPDYEISRCSNITEL